MQQPKSLPILFLAESVERFSFWGIQALLLLYLTKALHLDSNAAYGMYGAFTALTFTLSIAGGVLADRLFGFRQIFLLGITLTFLGNLLLMVSNVSMTYFGLGLIICGSGLFVPNNASLLGTFYTENDARRNKGFTIFYMGTNVGGLLGPIIYGVLSTYGWHYPFMLGALCMGLWLILYITQRHHFKDKGLPPGAHLFKTKYTNLLFYVVALFIIMVVLLLMEHFGWVGKLLSTVGIIAILALIIASLYQSPLNRKRIFALMIMIQQFSVNFNFLDYKA